MADVFQLLADPTRRDLLDQLRRGPRSVNELVGGVGITQPAVSKQLRILREAGIVAVRPDGRRRLYSLRGTPLKAAADWLKFYEAFWQEGLSKMEALLAEPAPRRKRGRR